MATISIDLSEIQKFVSVELGDFGTIKVYQLTSNKALRQSELMREMAKIEKNKAEVEKTGDEAKAMKLIDEAVKFHQEILEITKSRVKDDEGGRVVEALFESVDIETINKIISQADEELKK